MTMTDSNHETDPKQEAEDQAEAQGVAFELEEEAASSRDADSSREESAPPDTPAGATGAAGAHKITADGDPPVFGLDEEEEAAAVPPELRDGPGPADEEFTSGAGIEESAVEKDTDAPLIVDLEEAKRVVETLLFVTHEPLRPRDISMVFRGVENVNAKVVRKLLAELIEEYEDRTIQIQEVAEGYRMSTRMEMSPWVRRFFKNDRKWRVSNAGLETLAIIAYKQPITKAEVEHIRRVDCSGVIHTLLERKMLRILGRRDVVGKPIVYGTTPQFLEHFGFKNLTDMPKPEEFDVELGGQGPGGDILPIEEEMGLEALVESSGEANGSANGHADGSANGSANGRAEAEAIEADEEESTPAKTEEKETVSAEIETIAEEESEEEIQ